MKNRDERIMNDVLALSFDIERAAYEQMFNVEDQLGCFIAVRKNRRVEYYDINTAAVTEKDCRDLIESEDMQTRKRFNRIPHKVQRISHVKFLLLRPDPIKNDWDEC